MHLLCLRTEGRHKIVLPVCRRFACFNPLRLIPPQKRPSDSSSLSFFWNRARQFPFLSRFLMTSALLLFDAQLPPCLSVFFSRRRSKKLNGRAFRLFELSCFPLDPRLRFGRLRPFLAKSRAACGRVSYSHSPFRLAPFPLFLLERIVFLSLVAFVRLDSSTTKTSLCLLVIPSIIEGDFLSELRRFFGKFLLCASLALLDAVYRGLP